MLFSSSSSFFFFLAPFVSALSECRKHVRATGSIVADSFKPQTCHPVEHKHDNNAMQWSLHCFEKCVVCWGYRVHVCARAVLAATGCRRTVHGGSSGGGGHRNGRSRKPVIVAAVLKCRQDKRGLNYFVHKFLADWPDFFTQCGAEHHNLLVVWGLHKDLLDIATHVWLVKHLVALVKDKVFQVFEFQVARVDEGVETAWGARHNVRRCFRNLLLILGHRDAAKDNHALDVRHVLGEPLVLGINLVRKFTGVAHHKNVELAVGWFELLEGREDEDRRLAHARLGLADHIGALNGLRDALSLDCFREREEDVVIVRERYREG